MNRNGRIVINRYNRESGRTARQTAKPAVKLTAAEKREISRILETARGLTIRVLKISAKGL